MKLNCSKNGWPAGRSANSSVIVDAILLTGIEKIVYQTLTFKHRDYVLILSQIIPRRRHPLRGAEQEGFHQVWRSRCTCRDQSLQRARLYPDLLTDPEIQHEH